MNHLTVGQRYTIERMLDQSHPQYRIAEATGKDKSVISRELKRNCDLRNGTYRSSQPKRSTDSVKKRSPKKSILTMVPGHM